METKDIRQTVTFKARAHAVYDLLMDAKKHSKLAAGDDVKISRKVGGKFNVGGYYEDLKQGWIDYYWTPMKELLEK